MNKHVFKAVKSKGCCFSDNDPLNLLSIRKRGRQMLFLICERQRLTFARSVKCMECIKHMGCEAYGLTDRCLLTSNENRNNYFEETLTSALAHNSCIFTVIF